LSGNGVVNPGTTSTEGTNWLQVTARMSYNNPTPSLLDSDDTASTDIFLTPDRVYENNGAGVLRVVLEAQEETTSGQSITYYEATTAGLAAYTLVAPIGALKVIDGDTAKFKMVKFNLGGEKELMAPLIHSFIADQSKTAVTKLFLNGAHLSVYIARYEIIQPAGLSLLEAAIMLVLIIVVIVITVVSLGTAAPAAAAFIAAITAATAAVAITMIFTLLVKILIFLVIQYIIKEIITEVAKHDVALAAMLGIVAAIGLGAYSAGGLMDMTSMDMALTALNALNYVNLAFEVRDQQVADELATDQDAFDKEAQEKSDALLGKVDALQAIKEEIFGPGTSGTFDLVNTSLRTSVTPMYAEHMYELSNSYYEVPLFMYDVNATMEAQLSTENVYI